MAQKVDLPKDGNLSKMPTYLTPTYDQAGIAMNEGTSTCVLTDKPTMYSLYMPDAYRLCAMANLEPTDGPVDQYAKIAEAVAAEETARVAALPTAATEICADGTAPVPMSATDTTLALWSRRHHLGPG